MDSFLETLKNLGAGRLAMMLVTFFGLIVFFIFIAVRSSAPSMTTLYANLDTSDSTEIAAKLDNTGISYRISEDGKQVSVPSRDIGRARMLLAADGLPRQGSVGYEIFDQKQGFGITSFQQNINQVRALEGELSRTIGSMAQVKSARVHLVLPQRELFSRESRPSSASVFLNLRNPAGVGQEQIQSIQHLIAAAVPQLKAGNVAIIDQNGNMLARGEEEAGPEASARTSEDMRKKYELRLSRSIEDIVGRIVGFGRVRASVTADLNFDVVSRNSESYSPEGQVARSTQTTSEESADSSGGGSGGNVSVSNNLPGLGGGGGESGGGGSKSNRTEEVTNYEISKTIENVVRAGGQVNKLSIAVLVDGKYEPDTSVQKPADAPEDWAPPKKYVARAPDEVEKVTELVKSAVGFDEERGDKIQVINMQFTESEDTAGPAENPDMLFGFPKSALIDVAETLSLSIVAVLIILLVLRPLAAHFAATARSPIGNDAGAEQALLGGGTPQGQLAGPATAAMLAGPQGQGELDSMLDMSAVDGKVKASSVQKISELVTNHPNETVSVIRQWMSTDN